MSSSSRTPVKIYLLALVVGWAWALYTNHIWEDYFITYRAAKNLATGHGLVFTPGEKLHTFTSPLGVLFPALGSLLTGNSSDIAALWIFRFFSIAAYAGVPVILWSLMRKTFRTEYPGILLVSLYLADAKIVDFSTNGMETAFLLLFLAWFLYALLASPSRQAWHVGLAAAGLMWSRPDSFVYIGALSLGTLFFQPRPELGSARWATWKMLLQAGAIAAACYLPWFLWAWWYYGGPIPHTIVAKGLDRPPINFSILTDWLIDLPSRLVRPEHSLAATFMPAYAHDEKAGWLVLAVGISRLLALVVSLIWLLPIVRWQARVTSFAFAVGHLYLIYFASFHYPWYVPVITLLGFATIALVAGSGSDWVAEKRSAGVAETAVLPFYRTYFWGTAWMPLGGLILMLCAAHQLETQQRLIENGQRKSIGLWLHEHAVAGHDRVFLEPLGYIGFYSGLKMLDYPGLSSLEVVNARRKILAKFPDRKDREGWADIVKELKPEWLVLRPFEAERIRQRDPRILTDYYQKEKIFDVSEQIMAVKFLPGRPYLFYDEKFEIYHLLPDAASRGFDYAELPRFEVTLESIRVVKAFSEFKHDGRTLLTHAPSVFRQTIPEGATMVRGRYGFFEGAYRDPASHTPGAEFIVTLCSPDGKRQVLLTRFLQPYSVTGDRGDQDFTFKLPPGTQGEIEFVTSDARVGNNMYGWTYWKELEFILAR